MSQVKQAVPDTEECYKCQGDAGSVEQEGPHFLWMPCYRCGNTGRLPWGSKAADLDALCRECEGAGVLYEDHPEEGPVTYNCRACGNTGRKRGTPGGLDA